MKKNCILTILFIVLLSSNIKGQFLEKDSISAQQYINKYDSFYKTKNFDSANYYIDLYLEIINNSNFIINKKTILDVQNKKILVLIQLRKFSEALSLLDSMAIAVMNFNNMDNIWSNIFANRGIIYYYQSLPDKCLQEWKKLLDVQLKVFGEENAKTAAIYNNIGNVYNLISNYDSAIYYLNKSLQIKLNTIGFKHIETAYAYNNIGLIYYKKSDLMQALKYLDTAFILKKELLGNEDADVALTLNNIGLIYFNQMEYDKAMEFHNQSLNIKRKILGENHIDVAMSLNNIGNIHQRVKQFNKALDCYSRSYEIIKNLYGEQHHEIASIYNNFGIIYNDLLKFDSALFYHYKCLNLRKNLFTGYHIDIAKSYNNIAFTYYNQKAYNLALENYNEALEIMKTLFDEKGIWLSDLYYNIAEMYNAKNNYDSALYFYQQAETACYPDNNVLTGSSDSKIIDQVFAPLSLLKALSAKGLLLYNNALKSGNSIDFADALQQFNLSETVAAKIKKEMASQTDKINFAEFADNIYKMAIVLCLKLSEDSNASYYKNIAWQFTEKNKASVLLESLSGTEAMKFAGIPDSLLEKEHKLQIDIALYKRLLSEQPDSAKEANFRDRLFKANRNYEELIQQFEKGFPNYHNLKYGQNIANVSQLQQTLDKTTAIISYQETDSVWHVFYIDKANYQIYTTPKRSNYQEIINVFRQSLVNTSPNNPGLHKAAHFLYKQLFPFTIESHIQNLIIVPEGSMCLIPFEALITEEYKGNPEQHSNYAYLLKKYNISYAYSASLFYRTFPKTPTKKVEVTQLNDWLAIAPVFDDVKTGGASFRTRQLLRDMERIKTDTITTRAFMLTGEYITPLPGTEMEVKNIYNKFENLNKKAVVQFHGCANETFIKSEELKNYKYLHFASHGMVNMQKPELSGIILAQDSASGEDGILYSGEIYNLKLNADLTVLSACETGLGEIKKGEGLIGLTRALLYAGSKNIIVSLWKVADNSTSQLMVDFYDILLKDEKNTTNYSSALQQAKLKMISEGKYSHPFYWSPFILIGK